MKRRQIKTTAIISLLLAVTMLSASLVWGGGFMHTTNGPYGGVIQAMVVASDGAIYTGVYKGWTFKSVDGGDNWVRSKLGIPNSARDIRALVASPGTVYAGSFGGGVLKKLNSGSTWSQMNTNLSDLDLLSLLLNSCSSGILYAGTNGSGVYRWTDPGPWEQISDGALTAAVLTLAMTSDCSLYLGRENDGTYYGVYYYDGAVWQARNAGLPANTTVRSLLPDGNNLWAGTGGQGVYYWDGSTWSARNAGLPAGGAQNVSVIGLDGNGQVYAGTEDGFYHWTGSQWELRDSGLEGNGRHVNVFVSTGGETLYAGSDGRGVFGSTNGGLAWMEKNAGLSGHVVRAVGINPQYDWRIFAGTYRGGIYWSVNGGQSWNWWSQGLGDVEVETLAVTYPAGTPIYTGLNGQGVYRRDKIDELNHWTDWMPKNSGLTGNALIVRALAIAPDDPNFVFAGTDGGVYRSSNTGDDWSLSSAGLPYAVTALAIDPINPLTMCAGTRLNGVYRSADRGQNWTPLSGLSGNAAKILSLAIDSNQNILAGTMNGIYRYTGGTWQEDGLQGTEIDSLVVNPISQTVVYAGSAEGTAPIGVVENSQGYWQPMNLGLENLNVHALAIDDYHPQTLHAGTGGSSVWDYTFADALPEMTPEMGINLDDGVTLVHLGDLLTYTLTYYNSGSVDATGVVVSMTLPNNTEYVGSDAPFEEVQPNIYWLEVPAVEFESVADVHFIVRIRLVPPYPTTITANAKVWDDGGSGLDPFLYNNKDSDVDSVELGDLAISLEKEAQPPDGTTVSPGSLITYSVRYENVSFLPCSSGVLTDTYDQTGSYTFVSAVPPPDEGDNIWHPATLGPGEAQAIQIIVQLADALPSNWPVTNQVSLACAEGGPYDSNIVQHTVVNPPDVHLPDLTIDDIQWQPTQPVTNTPTDFEVTVRNQGVIDLNGYFWVELYIKPFPSDFPQYPSDHDQGYCLNGCNDLRPDYVQLVSGILPAGASFTVPFSGAQLVFPASGYYDIYAQADVAFTSAEFNPYWGHIPEETEDNNMLHKMVHIRGGGGACQACRAFLPIILKKY